MATEVLIRGVAALGIPRLRELAESAGLDPDGPSARTLAGRLIRSVERPEDLNHRGLTDADIEAMGKAIGVGSRNAWRPKISAEEFERLPFYQKPSYDQDVWSALLSNAEDKGKGKAKPSTARAKSTTARAKPAKAKAKAKPKPIKAKAKPSAKKRTRRA